MAKNNEAMPIFVFILIFIIIPAFIASVYYSEQQTETTTVSTKYFRCKCPSTCELYQECIIECEIKGYSSENSNAMTVKAWYFRYIDNVLQEKEKLFWKSTIPNEYTKKGYKEYIKFIPYKEGHYEIRIFLIDSYDKSEIPEEKYIYAGESCSIGVR